MPRKEPENTHYNNRCIEVCRRIQRRTVKGHKCQWTVRDKIGACFGTRHKIYQTQIKVLKSEAAVSLIKVQCRVTNFLLKERI